MLMADKCKPIWITVSETADILGVTRQRVHQLLQSGGLTGTQSGRTWLISIRSIEARQAMMKRESDRIYGYR